MVLGGEDMDNCMQCGKLGKPLCSTCTEINEQYTELVNTPYTMLSREELAWIGRVNRFYTVVKIAGLSVPSELSHETEGYLHNGAAERKTDKLLRRIIGDERM